ncbi:MAG: hypothetical protein ACOYEV_03625 [Candidatus Nanopelagicales bacterium]
MAKRSQQIPPVAVWVTSVPSWEQAQASERAVIALLWPVESVDAEIAYAAEQGQRIEPETGYEPGVRAYFDARKLVADGRAEPATDGLLRVTREVPLAKYLLGAEGVADIPEEISPAAGWTPVSFLAAANAVLQLRRAEQFAGLFPLGPSRRERKRQATLPPAEYVAEVPPEVAIGGSPGDRSPLRVLLAGPLPFLLGLLAGTGGVLILGLPGVLIPVALGVLTTVLEHRDSPAAPAAGRAAVGSVLAALMMAIVYMLVLLRPGG